MLCRARCPARADGSPARDLRTNLTFAELAYGNGASPARWSGSTCWWTAPWCPRWRSAAKVTLKQKHYSGKHKRHGVNIQTVCAPDGTLLWCSAALPGACNDAKAFARHKIAQKTAGLIGMLADLGYKGIGGVITGWKKPRGARLTSAQKAANRVHAALRSIGERGNAQLKYWRVLSGELRCRPGNCTRVVKACLALDYLENDLFAA
jgi:hypothetical protein